MADKLKLSEAQELLHQAGEAYDYLRRKTVLSGCTSYTQRMLQCGFNRAVAVLEILETLGVLSAPDNQGVRHWLKGEDAGRAFLSSSGKTGE